MTVPSLYINISLLWNLPSCVTMGRIYFTMIDEYPYPLHGELF